MGTYKGEPGGAKFYNIKSTLTLTLKLILNPRSPYLRNLDPPYMCHDPRFERGPSLSICNKPVITWPLGCLANLLPSWPCDN